MRRLSVIAFALIALTGCFQAETHIVLAPDGSGTFAASSHFTPDATRALRQLDTLQPEQHGLQKVEEALPHKPNGAERKALAAAGLHSVKVKVVDTDAALGADLSLRFDSVAALGALSKISGSDVPQVSLTGDPAAPTFKLLTRSATPSTDAQPQTGEMSPDVAAKATAIVSSLMAEASAFHVTVTVEVPGTITASTPSFGVVDGGTITWTVDAAMMMARMGAADASPVSPDGYAATFTPTHPLPKDAITPAPASP